MITWCDFSQKLGTSPGPDLKMVGSRIFGPCHRTNFCSFLRRSSPGPVGVTTDVALGIIAPRMQKRSADFSADLIIRSISLLWIPEIQKMMGGEGVIRETHQLKKSSKPFRSFRIPAPAAQQQ
jgi:hypothetical protein